jgi:tRNA/tmRNA/rRNA uracil-C5-methylase (TrmA/RlmC/RlmD family)
MEAKITGVDLVPESTHHAEKLATDGGFHDAKFIEINVLKIMEKQNGKYDTGFTSEDV